MPTKNIRRTTRIRYKCPTEDCGDTYFYRSDYILIAADGDEIDQSEGDEVRCRECDEIALLVDELVDVEDDDTDEAPDSDEG